MKKRYFLHKYYKQERPKTVKEWSKFFDISENNIYKRIKDKYLIEIDLSEDNLNFIHNFKQ